MWYAIVTIFRQPGRYIPAILTVAMAGALLLGQLSMISSAIKYITLPITTTSSDLWVCRKGTESLENPIEMPRLWEGRVASQPGVNRTELQMIGLAQLKRRNGQIESCIIVGTPMTKDSIGTMSLVSPELRELLSNPGTFACYESDLPILGLDKSEKCEISGKSVNFIGTVPGKQYTIPYLLCSIETAEKILPMMNSSLTSYILATCDSPETAKLVADRLSDDYPEITAYTRDEFIHRIRVFILTESRTGLVILCVTIFSAAISVFVTSQTLYAATLALKNEMAVLDALGISLRRLSIFVLLQALIIGVFAGLISVAIAYIVNVLMSSAGIPMEVDPTVYGIGAIVSMFTIVVSALIAQRSLRLIEPAELLH